MQINVNVNQLHVTTKEHMYFQFVFVISQAGKERENTVGSGNKQQCWCLASICYLIQCRHSESIPQSLCISLIYEKTNELKWEILERIIIKHSMCLHKSMSLSIVIYSSDYLTFRTLYEANNRLCKKNADWKGRMQLMLLLSMWHTHFSHVIAEIILWGLNCF